MAIETGIEPQKATTSLPSKKGISQKHFRAALREVGAHIVLLPRAFVLLLPFLAMLSTSLKRKTQLYAYPPVWIPNPFEWSNYPNTVVYIPFFLYLQNTLTIAILSTLGALISCSLVAYSLARIPWPG